MQLYVDCYYACVNQYHQDHFFYWLCCPNVVWVHSMFWRYKDEGNSGKNCFRGRYITKTILAAVSLVFICLPSTKNLFWRYHPAIILPNKRYWHEPKWVYCENMRSKFKWETVKPIWQNGAQDSLWYQRCRLITTLFFCHCPNNLDAIRICLRYLRNFRHLQVSSCR